MLRPSFQVVVTRRGPTPRHDATKQRTLRRHGGLPLGGGGPARAERRASVEGGREYLVNRVREHELDRLARLLRELLEIRLVLARDHDLRDPGPLRRER